jgi:hypothetical protein
LALIPSIGVICLFAGVLMAIIERRRAPFLFFFPFAISECYVRIAGVFHGRLSAQATVVPVCIFAFVQIALVAYIAYRLRAAKLAGWALTVFSLSYLLD